MIEAILWDFGGVLTSSPFESFNQFERAHRIPKDFIRGVNATHPETNAWAQFESNQVSLDEFDDLFRAESEAKGHAIGGKQVIELLSGEVRPRMINALKICKAHFSVGCITNNIKPGKGPGMASTDERAARVAEVMELFDVIVESSVEGVRKPDPKIYASRPRNAARSDSWYNGARCAKAHRPRRVKLSGSWRDIARSAGSSH